MTKLLDSLASPEAIQSSPFELLKNLSIAVNNASTGAVSEADIQRLVLYALENREHFGAFSDIVDGLLRSRGLYPYMREDRLSPVERLSYEAHKPVGMDDIVFHQKQSEVYLRLLAGENVVLSAPTSFGKSLLIDAMIATGKYNNVAVVVPTIALIDETRRRLSIRFGNEFKVITHASQEREGKNIFVMTQERILDFDVIPDLDFFIIDEFYKLDPRRDSDRSFLLNQALYKLLRTGAQFYMLGPSIERIPDAFGQTLRSTFISTPYATVVTEQVSIASDKHDSLKKLVELCDSLNEATLIYCASPASARRVATALIASNDETPFEDVLECSEWMSDNYHPDWVVARALKHGIGVHHGKVPRALSQYSVRAFNEGHLKYLVCTSTLIEGVNTKAKNVIIYDNRVATRKFDFFTFNNIRGRSGRMFHHFVGRVFLFSAPPQDDLPFVDVPLVNQGEDTPDSFLIHLEDDFLVDESKLRMRALHNSAYLSIEVMRSNSGIDPSAQIELAKEIHQNFDHLRMLSWRGFPDYEQLKFSCELIWRFFTTGRKFGGVSSGSQLAFRIDRLSKARSVKKLIFKELATQDEPDADAAVEDVLDFTRTWAAFHFPRYLMALDRIQREVFERGKLAFSGKPGDYSAFAASVENLFTSSGLVALDEYGIPLQIAEQLGPFLGNHDTVDEAISGLRSLRVERVQALTSFERKLVADAKASLGAGRRTLRS